jgi:deazaflavin-dependent oxidoreductase (nitroreductase family)
MPLPRSVTHFTKRVANPIIGRFAGQLPGFGMLHHVGRRSGKDYWIPVNVFLRGGDYIIGLTYGPDVDWAKNLLAAGTCELRIRGRTVRLVNPSLETDESVLWAPAPARPILRILRVFQYVRLRVAA